MTKEIYIRSIRPEQGNKKFSLTGEILTTFKGSKIVYAASDRGQPVAIKIPVNKQGAEREWSGLTKASESGISVPSPMMLGLTDWGSACIVLGRVYGKPLFLDKSYETRGLLGQTVRRMHAGVSIVEFESQLNGMINFTHYDKQLKSWGINQSQIGIDSSFTQYLFQLFSQPMDNYCETASPVFNHNDIHDGQVFISAKKDLILIDFEDWTVNRSLNDLGFYLFHCLRSNSEIDAFKSFMDGYFENGTLNESDKQALIYNLLYISTRAVIRFMAQKTDYLETARENHKKVLDFIRNEVLWKTL